MTTNTASAAKLNTCFVTLSGVTLELRPYDGYRLLIDERPDARKLESSLRECKVRVESAFGHLPLVPERVHTVAVIAGTLSGAADLSVALAVLGRVDLAMVAHAELALDGRLRPCRGDFNARVDGAAVLLASGEGAAWRAARGEHVLIASTLAEVLDAGPHAAPLVNTVTYEGTETFVPRRVCYRGKRGSGMVLAARAERDALPAITAADHGEVLAAQSDAGLLHHPSTTGLDPRPFRAPHHSCSRDALVGKAGRPGEAQLARHGVLMLDELVEFRMDALEGLAAAIRYSHVVVIATHYTDETETATRKERFERAVKLLGLTIEDR